MSRVFVNYRNGDGEYAATHIYEFLTTRLGAGEVFKSSESIPPGAAYAASLKEAAGTCDVMLSIIGPRWLSIADESGEPRLLRPADWVRQEIAIALESGRRVVPVLLSGARMPVEDELPPDIKALAGCQRRDFDHRHAAPALARLAKELQEMLPGLAPAGEPKEDREPVVRDEIQFNNYGSVRNQIGKTNSVYIGSGSDEAQVLGDLRALSRELEFALARGLIDRNTHRAAAAELTTAISRAGDPRRPERFLESMRQLGEVVRNAAPLVALIAIIIGKASS
jgi:hypothetical protein